MITSLSVNTGGLGRFGNQLFTIAGTIGIATKSGQPYGFPKWINQDNALFGGQADNMSQYFVNPLPELPEGVPLENYPYFWGYRDIHLPTGSWNIHAHLQDPRFFEHCIPLIRETFRMKDEPPQNDYVAIHYRAGDYQEGADAYHPRQTREYYEKAMAEFPGSTFLLFSDDLEAALKVVPLTVDYIVDQPSDYIEEFKGMKRCRSFITANSSFSYMAALLGEHPEKKIVMPKMWFGSSASITFDGYHKDAIVI